MMSVLVRRSATLGLLAILLVSFTGCAKYNYKAGRLESLDANRACIRTFAKHDLLCWNKTIVAAVPTPTVGTCVNVRTRAEDDTVAVFPASDTECR